MKPRTLDPPSPPAGGSGTASRVLVEETYRTDRGRRRRRVVELEFEAAPAGLLAPGEGDQRDWQLVRERLASMVGQSRFDIWLGSLWLAAVARDGALVLIAPEESRRWVYERFARVIADAARDVGRCARFAETAQARAIELLAERSSPPSPASTPASRGHRPPGRAVRGRGGDSSLSSPAAAGLAGVDPGEPSVGGGFAGSGGSCAYASYCSSACTLSYTSYRALSYTSTYNAVKEAGA